MADIVTISVSMPAEMQRLIMERIKARFFGNISEYFRHLVRRDLEQPGGPLSPDATGGVPAERPTQPIPRDLGGITPAILRQANADDLVAFAAELASTDPTTPGRYRRMAVGDLIREELEQRQLPIPEGLTGSLDLPPGFRKAIRRPNLRDVPPVTASFARGELRDEDVATLRKQLPPAKIERLLKSAKAGSNEAKRLDAMLRVLRGEGTPKQRFAWWQPIDIDFFDLLLFRFDALERGDDEGLGGAAVRAPRPPKPKQDSARAKPPKAED
ncbi:MAG: hypothetical protein IT434_01945 [Phycisphaerales bacterium]|nr:hypothetical protein [Phycisphaerales bacterium]